MRFTFIFSSIAALVFLTTGHAEPSVEVVASRLAARDPLLVKELANIAPPELDSLLRDVWRATIDEHPDAAAKAYQMLANSPGIDQLYRQRILDAPHLKENGLERSLWMKLLASFKTRWALNLLGEVLSDPRPLTTRYTPEQEKLAGPDLIAAYSNAHFAASIIGGMKLKHWPLGDDPDQYTDADVNTAKQWWQQMKTQPDSYFFAEPNDASLSPSRPEPPLQSRVIEPVKPPASETKPTVPSHEPSDSMPWSIIVVMIAAAIGLLWVVLKKRD